MFNKIALAVAATLACLAPPSFAQCIFGEGLAPQSAANIRVHQRSGWSSSSPISGGIDMWKTCGTYGTGFPNFNLEGSGDFTVSISLSNERNPAQGDTGCGKTQILRDPVTGRITQASTIIYAFSGATGTSCANSFSETVAHELGHVLGMGDSPCTNYIMGPNNTPDVSGCRSVQSSECFTANKDYTLPAESGSPSSSPGSTGGGNGTSDIPYDYSNSPIVVDLGRGDYRFTDAAHGVSFDINGDGAPDRVAWTEATDDVAFIWLDRNGNGSVDGGRELFGDAMQLENGLLAPNGFETLRELDNNGDGRIDPRDPMWQELHLWVDRNHDGVSQPDEISLASESRLISIDLDYHWTGRHDRFGNELRYEAKAIIESETGHSQSRAVYDVFFATLP